MKKLAIIPAILVIAIACSSLPKVVKTISAVSELVYREYANLQAQGRTTPEQDVRAKKLYDNIQLAVDLANIALKEYEAGGDYQKYAQAVDQAKSIVALLIDMVTPMVTQEKATNLRTDLASAAKP